MEVEAVDEGTLGKILVPGGTEGVKVNEPIALLLEEGEDKSALDGACGGTPRRSANGEAKPAPQAEPAPAGRRHRSAGAPSIRRQPAPIRRRRADPASPLARRMAAQAGLDLDRASRAAARTAGSSRPTSRRRCKGGRSPAAAPEAKPAPAAAPPQPHPAPRSASRRRRRRRPPTTRSRSPTCAR